MYLSVMVSERHVFECYGIGFASLFIILRLDSGTVPTVLYFFAFHLSLTYLKSISYFFSFAFNTYYRSQK
jgi:hypothetical protein